MKSFEQCQDVVVLVTVSGAETSCRSTSYRCKKHKGHKKKHRWFNTRVKVTWTN